MNGVDYQIRIQGLKTPEGTISLIALREILGALMQGAERTLRLSVEGASIKRGRAPAWLSKSLDFTVSGISKGSTVLDIEAPTLGQSAPEQVSQQNLWYKLPDPNDTALSLLSKSVLDAVSERLESEYFDRGVLSALLSFKPPLEKYLDKLEVVSSSRPKDSFEIGLEEIAKIGRLEAETPEPHAVVLAGSFNLIEHTQRLFKLNLEDGRKISGKAETPYINEERMRDFWGKKVLVKGTAHFTPSGKIRFIEAQVVRPFEAGEEIFQSMPEMEVPVKLIERLKPRQKGESPLREIWGQWPGEEPIEELLFALKKSSVEG